MKTLVSC